MDGETQVQRQRDGRHQKASARKPAQHTRQWRSLHATYDNTQRTGLTCMSLEHVCKESASKAPAKDMSTDEKELLQLKARDASSLQTEAQRMDTPPHVAIMRIHIQKSKL